AVAAGPDATRETLESLSLAIEKHPKSSIMKNLPILSNVLFKVFDLRREQLASGSKSSFDLSDLDEIEELLNELTIKMIYTLNGAGFRPLLTKPLDWATAGLSTQDAQGTLARLSTFYNCLQVFFGSSQSILRGHASSIIENIVAVFRTANPPDKISKPLWL